LCWSCYYRPGVRELHPSNAPPKIPVAAHKVPAPTDALPGTEAKIQVLAERFRRGEALFHPLDPWHSTEGRRLGNWRKLLAAPPR
jgi:hypothetical protein